MSESRPTSSLPAARVSFTSGIGRTLLIAFLALSLLPIFLVAGIGTYLSAETAQTEAFARLRAVSELKTQSIRNWLGERQQDLKTLLTDKYSADLFQSVLSNPRDPAAKAALTERLRAYLESGQIFARIFLLDQAKQSIVSTDERMLGTGHGGKPYSSPGALSPISTLYFDNNLAEYQVVFALEVVDSVQRPIGTLVGQSSINDLSKIVTAGSFQGKTDETYLVSNEFTFLTNTRFPHSGGNAQTTGAIDAIKGQDTAGRQEIYNNYDDVQVLGVYRYIPELGVAMMTEQASSEALARATQQALTGIGIALLTALVAASGAYFVTRRITYPINHLTEVATKVTAGDLNQAAAIERDDQIGALAHAFNTMTARLRSLIDSLETRVELRTAQLQASAEVGRVASSILDTDQLLKQAVDLIADRFGFYYVAAFILDAAGQWAMLREASGPGDTVWTLKQSGHRLEVGGQSMVSAAIVNRRSRIALDVGKEAVRFANPLLPATRSEIALPLMVGDRILGALDVQSTQAGAFDEASATVLQAMADQIAVALNNAAQYQHEQLRAEQITNLLEAAIELAAQTEATTLYQRIMQLGMALLDADGIGLWLPIGKDELELSYTVNVGSTDMAGRCLRIGEGLSGKVFASGLALRIDDYLAWSGHSNTFADAPFYAALGVPLVWQSRSIGVLVATHSQHGKLFSPEDENVAQLLAAQAAAALENIRLRDEQQRTLDELNSLNRRLIGEAWQTTTLGEAITYEYRPHSHGPTVQPPSSGGIGPAGLSLHIPIELRGQPIGVVALEDDRRHELDAGELALIQSVVQQMSLALENQRLTDIAQRTAQREKAIAGAADKIHRSTDLDAVLRTAVAEINRITGLGGVSIQLGFGQSEPTDGNGHRPGAGGGT